MNTGKILVTGATGFVGHRLSKILAETGHSVTAAVRCACSVQHSHPNINFVPVGDIGPVTDWSSALRDTEVIIHLAARVHVMKEITDNPFELYRRVNVDGTRKLATMAAQAGVKRIVFVSTIKVNGEYTTERPFREDDVPAPQDPYGLSKWEAEEVLHNIQERLGIEIVIIRPPLVYGPGVKGNMARLLRYVDLGRPLPFGNINNQRSFISLDNLVDILAIAATRAECAGQTFLVSDGENLATPDLIKKIACAMGKRSFLINFPDKAFSFIARIVPSLRPIAERLTGSLVIDSTKFREMFAWNPPQTIDDGIKSMVSHYLQNAS